MQTFLSHKYFRLTLLLIVLLWLVLKSPPAFIPLMDRLGFAESNPSKIYYYYIIFFSWLFASIPVFIFIFSKLDFFDFIRKYKLLIIVWSNFCYAWFRIFITFDVTDTGYHFSKAWGLLHGSSAQNIDFVVGTSFLNGLWLSIIGKPNVLWARCGYVLLVTAIAVISYKIYTLYFHKLTHWFIFIIVSIFFIHFNYYLSINYDNLPVFSVLLGVWLLLKNNKSMRQHTLAGFLLGASIWFKFNFIFIIFLPIAYGYILYENNEDWFKDTLFIYSGYLTAFIVGASLLFTNGQLNHYFNYIDRYLIHKKSTLSTDEKIYQAIETFKNNSASFKSESSDNLFFLTDSLKNTSERNEPLYLQDIDPYNVKRLFNSYVRSFWVVLKKGTLFSVLFLILLFLLGDANRAKHFFAIITFSFFIYYVAYIGIEGSDYIFLSSLIFPAYIYLFYYLRKNKALVLPTVLILMISLLSFPGSNLSFNAAYRSGAGLLMLSFPLAFMLTKKESIGKHIFNLNYYVLIFIGVITFSIIQPWGYNNSHRDLKDRSLLIDMFKSPQLFGIHTFPQRAEVIDEFLAYFKTEKYERNQTPALFIGWIPMMYYLTETNCMTNNPWHDCVRFDDFKDEYSENSKKRPPKYITFSKVMTRNPTWPLFDDEYRKTDKVWLRTLKKIDYIKFWMKDKDYQKVFENEMFEVHKKTG